MKIAITGKGGTGKTTFSAILARVLKDAGKRVIVIDADPDTNLSTVLGIPSETSITPITALDRIISERTGTIPGSPSPFFTMNPRVDDIPDEYSIDRNGVKLIVMGTINRGGGGCACPENAFIKSLLSHLVLEREEWVIIDMEAGIEHLGRGTATGVDILLMVVEPTIMSVNTAMRIKKLSSDIGLKNIKAVANKVTSEEDISFIKGNLSGIELLGVIRQSEEIGLLNSGKKDVFSIEGKIIEDIRRIMIELDRK